MASMFSSLIILANALMASGNLNDPLSPLLTSTLAEIKLQKRTARVRFASQARLCRQAIAKEQEKVQQVKALAAALVEDVKKSGTAAEELKRSLSKPLKDVHNAYGDVRAASLVRGMEEAQFISLKKQAARVWDHAPAAAEKEEKASQFEYDKLMQELQEKFDQAAQSQVDTGIAIGRMQQKYDDSMAALKSANTAWKEGEQRLKQLVVKCELETAAFHSQQQQWNTRIQVLESSLDPTALDLLPVVKHPLLARLRAFVTV